VWQKYAATTAAAFAKELLSIVKPAEVTIVKHVTEVISEFHPKSLKIDWTIL
jgi:hypothetical protein